MQTITTKYYGPTNYNGARIKAQTESGIKAWISYPYELSGTDCHWEAVKALLDKLQWKNKKYVCGSTNDGYIFVPENSTTYSDKSEFTF